MKSGKNYLVAVLVGMWLVMGYVFFQFSLYFLMSYFLRGELYQLEDIVYGALGAGIFSVIYYWSRGIWKNDLGFKTAHVMGAVVGGILTFILVLGIRFIWHGILVPHGQLFGLNVTFDWKQLLPLVFLIPILEEFFFRGIVLPLVLKISGSVRFSIVSTALLFAAIHVSWPQPQKYLIPVFAALAVGVASGIVWQKTRNIYLCIVLHAEYNLLVYLVRW